MINYISQEAVLDYLYRTADGYPYIEIPTEDAVNAIKAIPTADVRPVVYCKDCKHRFNYDICAYRGDDWFCGYGERKAENVASARRES